VTQSEWTQKAVAALENPGLVRTGFVNIFYTDDGAYRLEVADLDDDVFELTVRRCSS
jgi:hypothetical protein